jgi:hypothetical protein
MRFFAFAEFASWHEMKTKTVCVYLLWQLTNLTRLQGPELPAYSLKRMMTVTFLFGTSKGDFSFSAHY